MKYLSYLIWIVLIIAIGAIMLIFEVPPFNPGGPLLPAENSLKLSPEETKNIDPEIKVERAKSYEEYINRGTMLEEKGYLTLALSEYEAAAEQNPDKILPLIKMSEIYLQTEDLVQAKVYADLANEIDSENIAAKTMLGRVLIADRKLNEAKAIFDSIKSHNQTSRYYQAMLTSYIGDHANAKGLFKDAINMGGSSDISSNSQKFIAAYNEFDSNQGGAPVHLNVLLSRAYVYSGEYQIAISLLFEALQEKKNYRDAWILLGYSYLQVGKFGEAVDALEEATKLDSEKPQSYFYLGLAYYGLNNLPDAAANLELARKKNYEPKAHVDQKLAEIYLELKNYQASAEAFERVLAAKSSNVYYYIKPIWIYLERLDKPKEALRLANQAIAQYPTEAMSYNLVGWAKIYDNDFDQAEDFLYKAKAIDPNLDAVYLNYGTLKEKQGLLSEAINQYKKAYDLGNGNSISEAANAKYKSLIGKIREMDYATVNANVLQTSNSTNQ